jgi:hypothetical protein
MLRPALEADGRWDELVAALRAMYEDVATEEDGGISFDGEYLITFGDKR